MGPRFAQDFILGLQVILATWLAEIDKSSLLKWCGLGIVHGITVTDLALRTISAS